MAEKKSNHKKPEKKNLQTILFKDCKSGDYIVAQNFCSIYEVVRSGDVMPLAEKVGGKWNGGTFMPNACLMRCYWVHPKYPYPEYSPVQKGQLTEDFSENKFYGPYTKDYADTLIGKLESVPGKN